MLTFSAAGQAATPAAADSTTALGANSYADLLEPIPNAVALLQADNVAWAQQAREARIQFAQYHHHHNYRSYHHHHSHYPWRVFRGIVGPPAYCGLAGARYGLRRIRDNTDAHYGGRLCQIVLNGTI